MEQEKEWYEAKEYMETFVSRIGSERRTRPHIPKIVAEATRRGEVKAWEEAANLIDSHSNFTDGGVDVHYSPLSEAIDAKLAELKKV